MVPYYTANSLGIATKTVTFQLPGDIELEGASRNDRFVSADSISGLDLGDVGFDGSVAVKAPTTAGPQAPTYASATSASSARVQNPGRSNSSSRRAALNQKTFGATESSAAVPRQGRLPWLDGSQSRRFSVPSVPGAFVEDDHRPSKNITDGASSYQNQYRWKYDLPTGADASVSPAPNPVARPNVDSIDSGTASTSQSPVIGGPVSRHLSANTVQQIAVRAMDAPVVESAESRPAIPLVTLARQLHVSDSTASDVESARTAHGQSPREASDTTIHTHQIPLAMPQPLRTFQTPTITAPATNTVTQAGPEYSGSTSGPPENAPLAIPAQFNAANVVSGAGDRKISLSVQPLRQDKLVPDNMGAAADGDRSISVQPVRAKTWKELQPSSQDSKPTSGSKDIGDPVQEALALARKAAETHRGEDIPSNPDRAFSAVRDVPVLKHNPGKARVRAESVSTHTSSSTSPSTDDDPAPLFSLPGPFKPQHPAAVHHRPRTPGAASAKSARTAPKPAALTQPGVRTVWDEDWPNHRVGPEHPSVEARPSENDDVNSSAHDWAWGSRGPTKPVVLQKNVQFPSAPPAAQQSTREHVNLVNRGTNTQQTVRSTAVDGPPVVPPRKSSLATRSTPIRTATGLFPATDEPDSPGHGESFSTGARIDSNSRQWGADKFDDKDFESYEDRLKGVNHIVLRDGEEFHLGYKPQPIARNWSDRRKRWTAFVTCLNTALIGMLIGIYAGEVPAIQYALADRHHRVILGNVVLYLVIGLVVLIFWPLPLLHGRRPYTLTGLAVALPLQIPQAVIVGTRRGTDYSAYITGLLVCRALTGVALGFVHINLISTLLDLFGASLQSDKPHGEVVVTDDVRRHGGGVGLWLGFWSWCFIGSLAIGFLIGASVISGINISWGFYIGVILIAVMLLLSVITPETRRRPHRRTMQEVELPDNTISTRVARGEIKMHVYGDSPKWWWEEVFAGLYLSFRMLRQSGFLLMAIYLAWIYAQVVLIIVLLGNLLSANYRFQPYNVGLGVLGIAVGALLAIPSSKANIFSKSRSRGPRTDSMTFQPRFTWSSHFIRRLLFMTALPLAGLAYTLSSRGRSVQYMVPIVFAALIGYISNLAISECNGIIMETFDTSDLQPGVNNRHRLQSLPANIKRKRTTYSSYPRASAGLFTAQGLAYLLAAASTGVGGAVTRAVGAQKATAITAGILLGLTILLTIALVRYRTVQVIPNELFGHYFGSQPSATEAAAQRRGSADTTASDRSWRAVIIGNPSGKDRRMNWLELGSLSRWTEVRRLNRLLNRSTTQALNTGWQ